MRTNALLFISTCCWCWCQVWIHLNQHPMCTVRYSKAMKQATICTGKQCRSSASSNFWHICFSAELAEYDAAAAASYHRGVIVITGFQLLIYHHVRIQVATATGKLGFFWKLWCIRLRNVQFPERKTNMDASWQQMKIAKCNWAHFYEYCITFSMGSNHFHFRFGFSRFSCWLYNPAIGFHSRYSKQSLIKSFPTSCFVCSVLVVGSSSLLWLGSESPSFSAPSSTSTSTSSSSGWLTLITGGAKGQSQIKKKAILWIWLLNVGKLKTFLFCKMSYLRSAQRTSTRKEPCSCSPHRPSPAAPRDPLQCSPGAVKGKQKGIHNEIKCKLE